MPWHSNNVNEILRLPYCTVTAEEAEEAILDYLRDFPGQMVDLWEMLNQIGQKSGRWHNRRERQFYLGHAMRLVRENKVIRYRKHGLNKIRISEAYVNRPTHAAQLRMVDRNGERAGHF